MIRGKIDFPDLTFLRQPLHLVEEKPCIPVPSVLREGVYESYPGREFCRLDIILLSESTVGDEFVTFCEKQHV